MARLLIVASSRWGYLWQRHQSLAVAAADAGWDVDFLQPRPRNLRQVASYPLRMLKRTRVEQEHSEGHERIRIVGRKFWLRPDSGYDLALVYLPDAITEALLRAARPKRIIYDAVLDWATVPAHWYPPIGWRSSERRIAALPYAAVSTDAPGMAQLLAERSMAADVVPPAADDAFLARAGTVPWAERRKAALYFGAVRGEVDTEALVRLAGAGVPVDVVGPVDDPRVADELRTAGVDVRPPVTIDEIARIAQQYRIVVLPYRGSRGASLAPAKLFNAVSTGAWVLTSGIAVDDIDASGNLLVANDHAGLIAQALTALDTAPPSAAPTVPTWADRWRRLLAIGRVPA